jgi:ribosomal protein S19
VLQGAKEEVARVVVGWRDERMAMSMLPADVDVHNGEELLTVAVEEDDYY